MPQEPGLVNAILLPRGAIGVSYGKDRLVLHTGTFMPSAVRLYESMGFRRELGLDFTPVPGVDLIAYTFDLVKP